MLELFLVIYLCRRIKNIVVNKGYKPGIWQFWVVLVWYGLELGGAIAFMYFGTDPLIAVLSGLLIAAGGSIALQRYAQSLPDIRPDANNWLDKIGEEDNL